MGSGKSDWFSLQESQGFLAPLIRADADGVVDGGDENLTVTDFAGLGGFHDGSDRRIGAVVRRDDFEFEFRQEIHAVFTAPIDFGMAFLAAETFDFGDGHALKTDITERVFHFLQFERFYYRFDFLHRLLGLAGQRLATVARSMSAGSETHRSLPSAVRFRMVF